MSNKNEENRYYGKSTLVWDVCVIGFVGGILASFAGISANYFNFVEFSPKFILTSWSNQTWIKAWQGAFLTILLFGLLSIIIAYIYYILLKKMKSMFAYMLFGLVCWFILFWLFNPIFKDLPTITKLSANSIITSICIFVVYGVFIGYSISYDYQEYQKELDRFEDYETSK